MVDGKRLDLACDVGDGGERDLPARCGRDVDARQGLRSGLKFPFDLEDEIRLLGWQIDVGDLRLPERVLKRRVDIGDRDVEG
jgi:hypothetical protein